MSTMFKSVTFEQPKDFKFSPKNTKAIDAIIAKYPASKQQSAVMPLLDLAQRQHDNWIPIAAMDEIARILDMPNIRVYEIATFYSMYNKQPVGQHLVQVCRTTPCWLRGSDEITQACRTKLNIDVGETTKDGRFTLVEVECLGACVNAPMVQINDDYYEDLDPESMAAVLDELASGGAGKTGSRLTGRVSSEPVGDDNVKLVKKTRKKKAKISEEEKD